jgi:hypothetical protein
MPFRAPAASVLGPRPGTQGNQAYFAGPPQHHGVSSSTGTSSASPLADVWNHPAMPAALINSSVPPGGPQSGAEWYLDTGASSHMSSSGNLSSLQPLHSSPPITVGNGASLPVTHRARSTIPTATSPLFLNNILVSPSLVKNLISIRSLTRDNNVSVEFDPFGFSVKDLQTRAEIIQCNSNGELYPLVSSSPQALVAASPTLDLWHQRLGHSGRHNFHKTLENLDLEFTKSSSTTCEACQLGKHVRLPFSSSTSISYVPFQLVHADIWTSPLSSFSGFKYYLVIIDDFTHYIWTFPLRAKSEAFQCIVAFHSYVATQFRLPLLAFQSDNGREFDNHALRSHLAAHGTALRLSC